MDLNDSNAIDHDALLKVISERRSVRIFDTVCSVERDIIHNAIEAARWAPSACNKQGWEFIVLDDLNTKKKIAEFSGKSESYKQFIETPVLIYCLYTSALSPQKYAYVQSMSAAVQNLLLSLHTQGIGACWYSEYHDSLVRKYFNLPQSKEIICAIRAGYPKRSFHKAPTRKKIEDIVFFNQYSSKKSLDDPNKSTWEEIASVHTERIFTTSPEIGFSLAERKFEEQAIIKTILENKNESGNICLLFSVPGIVTFPLAQTMTKGTINALEFSPEIVDWLKNRQDYLNIDNQKLKFDVFSEEVLRSTCRNGDLIVLYEVLSKFSQEDRTKLIELICQNSDENTKILVLQTNPLYRLINGSRSFTRRGLLGPYEYLAAGHIKGLFKQNGFEQFNWRGINLFPSSTAIRVFLSRRVRDKSKFSGLFKVIIWFLQRLSWDSLEGARVSGVLSRFTKLHASIFKLQPNRSLKNKKVNNG